MKREKEEEKCLKRIYCFYYAYMYFAFWNRKTWITRYEKKESESERRVSNFSSNCICGKFDCWNGKFCETNFALYFRYAFYFRQIRRISVQGLIEKKMKIKENFLVYNPIIFVFIFRSLFLSLPLFDQDEPDSWDFSWKKLRKKFRLTGQNNK